jgi:hypothetical protein
MDAGIPGAKLNIAGVLAALIWTGTICHSCPWFAGTIQSVLDAAAGICCSIVDPDKASTRPLFLLTIM